MNERRVDVVDRVAQALQFVFGHRAAPLFVKES
jgi:hypothetical protein